MQQFLTASSVGIGLKVSILTKSRFLKRVCIKCDFNCATLLAVICPALGTQNDFEV